MLFWDHLCKQPTFCNRRRAEDSYVEEKSKELWCICLDQSKWTRQTVKLLIYSDELRGSSYLDHSHLIQEFFNLSTLFDTESCFILFSLEQLNFSFHETVARGKLLRCQWDEFVAVLIVVEFHTETILSGFILSATLHDYRRQKDMGTLSCINVPTVVRKFQPGRLCFLQNDLTNRTFCKHGYIFLKSFCTAHLWIQQYKFFLLSINL